MKVPLMTRQIFSQQGTQIGPKYHGFWQLHCWLAEADTVIDNTLSASPISLGVTNSMILCPILGSLSVL